MKRYLLVTLAILLITAFLLSSCGSPSPTNSTPTATTPASTQASEKTLRFSINVPPIDPAVIFMNEWAAEFNGKFAGRYKLEVFSGGALVGTGDTLEAVMTGAVEMGNGTWSTYSPKDIAFNVTEVPFLCNNFDAVVEFIKLTREEHGKIFETKFNQKLLSTYTIGFPVLYTAKKQVKTMEDLKGMLIASTGPGMTSIIKNLGGSPVTMDWANDLPSLQKGVVDGSLAGSPPALVALKYSEVIKYIVNAYIIAAQCGNTINLEVFNSLPADVQAAVVEEGKAFEDKCFAAFRKAWDDNFATLRSEGVTIYDLPADEHARWAQATSSVADAYWQKLDPKLAAFYKDCAAKANAKYPSK